MYTLNKHQSAPSLLAKFDFPHVPNIESSGLWTLMLSRETLFCGNINIAMHISQIPTCPKLTTENTQRMSDDCKSHGLTREWPKNMLRPYQVTSGGWHRKNDFEISWSCNLHDTVSTSELQSKHMGTGGNMQSIGEHAKF